MVQILCPHCEEEIELDDDASGEFACPHCDGEFEWNIQFQGSMRETIGTTPSSGSRISFYLHRC